AANEQPAIVLQRHGIHAGRANESSRQRTKTTLYQRMIVIVQRAVCVQSGEAPSWHTLYGRERATNDGFPIALQRDGVNGTVLANTRIETRIKRAIPIQPDRS